MIQEELDKMISKLKLKKSIKKLDFADQVLHSQLGLCFQKDVALLSCPEQRADLLVKPAHVVLGDHRKQISVEKMVLHPEQHATVQPCNNRVYLISRGCVYEQIRSHFNSE